MTPFRSVFGVDFSGARLAGENLWLARVEPQNDSPRPRLAELVRLGQLAGTDERGPVLRTLVQLIAGSAATGPALWGMDFPFALPVELFSDTIDFPGQLDFVARCPESAVDFGRDCVARALAHGGKMHIRRDTDIAARTPFDCYHYRIVHQTFWGMREVLHPLHTLHRPTVAILPFDDGRNAPVLVAEACPSSTLKRLGLPHQNYKQTQPGPLTPRRRAVRKTLYAALRPLIDIPDPLHRLITRNPGGDALDAVLAALGAFAGYTRYLESPPTPRARREGLIFF